MAVAGAAGGRITAGAGANLLGIHAADRNQDATCYVGNIDVQATEELIWELFVQAGPVVSVYLPKDRVTNQHQGYGFVEFRSEEDAIYALKILNMVKLYGKPIRVNRATQDKAAQDVGANLFIGNLDPDVDETLLYNTFSAFGVVVGNPKIMRDPESGVSKGFGFVSFDDFDASDAAIEAMNGQFLGGRPISVTYAFKKDTKGERHGTPAERLLAAQKKAQQPASARTRVHTMFATGPRQAPQPGIDLQQAPVMAMSGFAAGGPMPMPMPPMGMPNGGYMVDQGWGWTGMGYGSMDGAAAAAVATAQYAAYGAAIPPPPPPPPPPPQQTPQTETAPPPPPPPPPT